MVEIVEGAIMWISRNYALVKTYKCKKKGIKRIFRDQRCVSCMYGILYKLPEQCSYNSNTCEEFYLIYLYCLKVKEIKMCF